MSRANIPLVVHQRVADRSASAERGSAWRRGLPVLSDGTVVLRELRSRDASSLVAHLCQSEVQRYIGPCPSTVDDFRRFIRWTRAQRRKGLHACYGIIPSGETTPVGIIQIWPIAPDFSIAEWGFALGDSYWGTGVFMSSARLFLNAVFGPLGVFRLEARAVDANGRGNDVLCKLGATREGVLREGFRAGDVVRDHVMWSMLASEWPALGSWAPTAN